MERGRQLPAGVAKPGGQQQLGIDHGGAARRRGSGRDGDLPLHRHRARRSRQLQFSMAATTDQHVLRRGDTRRGGDCAGAGGQCGAGCAAGGGGAEHWQAVRGDVGGDQRGDDDLGPESRLCAGVTKSVEQLGVGTKFGDSPWHGGTRAKGDSEFHGDRADQCGGV